MDNAMNILRSVIKVFPFILSIIGVLTLIYDFGFTHPVREIEILNQIYLIVIFIGLIACVVRYLFKYSRPKLNVIPYDFLYVAFLLFIIITDYKVLIGSDSVFFALHIKRIWVNLAIILIFIREFSAENFNFKGMSLHPAQFFILSFMSIIVFGWILLLLPNATHHGISPIDALFTSTSAVCVTGLIVVDTGFYFTQFGQYVILLLIQLGGLGIMTFTSFV